MLDSVPHDGSTHRIPVQGHATEAGGAKNEVVGGRSISIAMMAIMRWLAVHEPWCRGWFPHIGPRKGQLRLVNMGNMRVGLLRFLLVPRSEFESPYVRVRTRDLVSA